MMILLCGFRVIPRDALQGWAFAGGGENGACSAL